MVWFNIIIRIECILLKFHWGMKALIELHFQHEALLLRFIENVLRLTLSYPQWNFKRMHSILKWCNNFAMVITKQVCFRKSQKSMFQNISKKLCFRISQLPFFIYNLFLFVFANISPLLVCVLVVGFFIFYFEKGKMTIWGHFGFLFNLVITPHHYFNITFFIISNDLLNELSYRILFNI